MAYRILLHELDYTIEHKRCVNCDYIYKTKICDQCWDNSFEVVLCNAEYDLFINEDQFSYYDEDGKEIFQENLDETYNCDLYHEYKEK